MNKGKRGMTNKHCRVKYWGKLNELPLSAIEPEGWLRAFLAAQERGLTGHLDECGYPFDTGGWLKDSIPAPCADAWGPYEQTGYWIDGMLRCAHLLKDCALLARARRPLERTLARQQADGYLGPKYLKSNFRWPHAVFLRALMAEHSATGDPRIAQAIARHYLSGTSKHAKGREVCNVEPMLWAYANTGDRRLLDEARIVYQAHSRNHPQADTAEAVLLSGKRASDHGVTYNEIAKLGAILYLYTGDQRALRASRNGYRKLDRDQMLIDGMHSCSEFLRGQDPLDTHETCDIADYTWSVGYLLMATGDAAYADKIERACFNALPGAVTEDFGALQYFSCPNQTIVDRQSSHGLYQRATDWMAYQPNPEVQCCPGEVNRVMPNYAARMWMSDGQGGIAAALYGPSRITVQAGRKGRKVTIVESTDYPFDESISFEIRTASPVRFALSLRIPGWCKGATLALNGKPYRRPCRPGRFVRIFRQFRNSDRIELRLPMELKLSRWPRGGVGLERGPLAYALAIPDKRRPWQIKGRSAPEMPGWDMRPAGVWNYALAFDKSELADQVRVERRTMSGNPWTARSAAVRIEVPARRVIGWTLDRPAQAERQFFENNGMVRRIFKGPFAFTPQLPDPAGLKRRLGRRIERVWLVPYGCTRLRIAVFPDGGTLVNGGVRGVG